MKQYLLLPLLLLFCGAFTGNAQKNAHDREMNRPMAPFRIAGNIYYVGASDVTAYLITTPQGHILIDGGFERTAPRIEANIKQLGFRLRDVRILLINHAHYDHCGGLAALKRHTGARLYASPQDAPVLADGGKSDFWYGGATPLFPPVKADVLLQDGQEIRLGDIRLKTYFTPGHTKGATTWTTSVTDHGKTLKVVFVSSVSTLDYPLAANEKYPAIAADFTHTFKVLSALNPDIFLGAHGQFFDLRKKAGQVKKGAKTNPFVDPEGYRLFIAKAQKDFEDRLAREKAPGK